MFYWALSFLGQQFFAGSKLNPNSWQDIITEHLCDGA